MKFIDTHCHIHDPEYNFDAEKTLSRAHYANVDKIIVIGTSPTDSLRARDFASAHDGVFWSYGCHPNERNLQTSVTRAAVEEGLLAPISSRTAAPAPRKDGRARERAPDGRESEVSCSKLIAIGEIGLDYHYQPYDRQQQIKLFEQYLDLAKQLNLPVIFHVREAFADFWPVVDNAGITNAVLHSFSDDAKNLEIALSHNFYIGVNGLATFAPLPIPPLESIVLETDAPYLTPTPFRDKINEPAYIPEIGKWVAQYFGVTLQEVARITTQNAEKLFHI